MIEHTDFFRLEKYFSIERIKADLYSYFALSESGIIEVHSHNDSNVKKSTFSRLDEINLTAIRTTKRYDGLFYLPYLVEIIVGEFEVNENLGTTRLEKFRADILYNNDFTIATIDYFH